MKAIEIKVHFCCEKICTEKKNGAKEFLPFFVLKQKGSFNDILLTIVIADIRKLKFQFRMHFKYSDFDHDLGLKNQRRSW